MKTIDFKPELTIFSHNNFSIIGRALALATSYENSMRSLLKVFCFKYPKFFIENIKKFTKIKIKPNIENLESYEPILRELKKLSFHNIINILLKEIPNIPELKNLHEKFLRAKETRNFIAHELCISYYDTIETDDFRNFLTNDVRKKLDVMIECMLIAEQWINMENKEPTLVNLVNFKNEIVEWAIDLCE